MTRLFLLRQKEGLVFVDPSTMGSSLSDFSPSVQDGGAHLFLLGPLATGKRTLLITEGAGFAEVEGE